MLLVDALEGIGHQPHADSAASVVGMSAEKAQVIVRLVGGMRSLELVKDLQDPLALAAQKAGEERLDLLLRFDRQLRAARRNPDGGRLIVGHRPGPGITQSAVDEEPPPGVKLLIALRGIRKRPSPQRVILEGEGEHW